MKAVTKNNQNKQQRDYKDIIIDRLNKPHQDDHKKSIIHSLKTQCTPSDKTQDLHQRFFEEFELNYRVQYRPVQLKEERKPIKRCLYLQLREIQERQAKRCMNKTSKKRLATQQILHKMALPDFTKNSNQKRKEDFGKSISKTKQKRLNTSMSRAADSFLTRQPSLTNLRDEREKKADYSSTLKRINSKKELGNCSLPTSKQKQQKNYKKNQQQTRISHQNLKGIKKLLANYKNV